MTPLRQTTERRALDEVSIDAPGLVCHGCRAALPRYQVCPTCIRPTHARCLVVGGCRYCQKDAVPARAGRLIREIEALDETLEPEEAAAR